jgi:hypothetical protein
MPPAPALTYPDPVARARAAFDVRGWHAFYGLHRRSALQIQVPLLHDVHFLDGLFVFRMALTGRFVEDTRTLRLLRDIDQEAKAVGPARHLYSGRFTPAFQLMWRYTGAAELTFSERAALKRSLAYHWFRMTREWAARVNLKRGSDAWRSKEYIRLVAILMKQLVLKPSDLVHQLRRRWRAAERH